MLSGEGNAGEWWKTTISLISKKKQLCKCSTLFYIGMPVVRTDGPSGGRSVGVRSRDYQIFSDG